MDQCPIIGINTAEIGGCGPGPGETEVIALGLELPDSLLIIDDNLARQIADLLGLRSRVRWEFL